MIALPSSWAAIAVGAAAAFAVGAASGWQANGWRMGAQIEALRAEHAELVAMAERETREAEAAQRSEEKRRIAAQQEVAHVASIARTHAEADRRAADAQHRRMLDAATAAAASAGRACGDPDAAGSREAAAGAVRTMVELFGEASREAIDMAAAADAARTAGLACESAYRALTPAQ